MTNMNMTELTGRKIKAALVAKGIPVERVFFSWHNKNNHGGNYGIMVQLKDAQKLTDEIVNTQDDTNIQKVRDRIFEFMGYHNISGEIVRLEFGYAYQGGRMNLLGWNFDDAMRVAAEYVTIRTSKVA